MYSREFSDSRLPPRYGGTAFRERHRSPPREEERPPCEEERPPCEEAPPPPPPREDKRREPHALFEKLLPAGLPLEDLLLLGLALLFLADGCDDDYLPLILLFLFVIR
ncbi:MAG: hypothetical protein J6V07_04580 [Clostridia bacterium]|nr:hypothetical protein [Clostridia bacterium]